MRLFHRTSSKFNNNNDNNNNSSSINNNSSSSNSSISSRSNNIILFICVLIFIPSLLINFTSKGLHTNNYIHKYIIPKSLYTITNYTIIPEVSSKVVQVEKIKDSESESESESKSESLPYVNVTQAHINGMKEHMFYIPEANLVFCVISKNAGTTWLELFLRIYSSRKDSSYSNDDNSYYTGRNAHFRPEVHTFRMDRISNRSKLNEIMNDKYVTRAVFFRNPIDRFISAYENKVIRHSKYRERHLKVPLDEDISMEKVINWMYDFKMNHITNNNNNNNNNDTRGSIMMNDIHFQSQLTFCNLKEWLPYFNFIGSFDYQYQHAKILLQEKLNVWEKYGKNFYNNTIDFMAYNYASHRQKDDLLKEQMKKKILTSSSNDTTHDDSNGMYHKLKEIYKEDFQMLQDLDLGINYRSGNRLWKTWRAK